MLRCTLICLLIIPLIQAEVSNTSGGRDFLFGSFYLLGTGHLTNCLWSPCGPLNIPSLKRAFDHYSDLQSAINKLISGNTESYNHLQSELKTLRSKLDIIHHLALTKQEDSHFSGVDDLNDFKEKTIANLGTKVNYWKTTTEATSASAVSSTLEVERKADC